MKNLKVSMKLLVGFGIAVALIITVGVVSIINLEKLNDDYSDMIDRHGVSLAYAGRILEAIHSLRAENRALGTIIDNKEALRKARAAVDELFKNFEENYELFSKTIFVPKSRELMTEAMERYNKDFKPGTYKMIDDALAGASKEDVEKYRVTVPAPAAGLIAKNMKECMDIKVGVLQDAQAKGKALSKSIFAVIVTIIIVGVIIAVLLGVYIAGLISKPVNSLSTMIGEWSLGHLSMRLNIHDRTDELGIMAKRADKWADDLQNVLIGWLRSMRDGDLSMDIVPRDPNDEIAISFGELLQQLKNMFVADGGKVLQAAAGKDLTQRLTASYKGEFARMKDNMDSVMQSLDLALTQVSEAVGQVTSATGEISSGAQSLAEGSNEQASSLEEVSSSLEEMSSMTKQNADNSNQAKLLATEARAAANEGDASMKRMANAIQQIKTSSDNTAKIIKSIDDIAFQTNLLALNAAVEAARAGEAGKGFAVVAEEVRNLAMRSAEAAKNTANMIEESVKNADGGVKITEEVAKSLSQIVDRTGKVGDLIAEIAAASNEQAQGIEQVNTAVAQMNTVTQQNAANSEESASAAEELSSQAAELANMVSAFTLSAGGAHSGHGARRALPPPPQKQRPIIAALPDKSGGKAKHAGKPAKPAKAVKAEEIIPLDDSEMGEF
jgi:methyl-accepting chemotaxis protein